MIKEQDNWYASWFDTPYYHILYKDRDYEEAGQFMHNLTSFLKLPKGASILDLACGKGRHSRHLHSLGYKVTGADLSKSSIQYAKQFETDGLEFVVHDMCTPIHKRFDAVFNLFTSFGYFEHEIDNLRTIRAIKSELNPNGYGVIDFLNVTQVANNLVASEMKTVDGIDFYIERKIEERYIIKTIRFTDGESYEYQEKVKALTLDDFKSFFEKAGVALKHCFGNYALSSFDEDTSERLILIFTL
ncbi:MAG: methyltransferase domain-containing protein [Gilvibacter sp.]